MRNENKTDTKKESFPKMKSLLPKAINQLIVYRQQQI